MARPTDTVTVDPRGKSGAPIPPAFAFVVVYGPDEETLGSVILVREDPVTVGRAQNARLAVSDVGVSRLHARFELRADELFVVDLGSHNGTLVNATRVKESRLAAGDVVRIGSTLLVVQSIAIEDAFAPKDDGASALLGDSVAIRRVRREVAKIGQSRGAALLLGESGAGKELVAQEIHRASGRGKLVPVNCGALPEQLAESELFGHQKGAFTGALTAREGMFEAADGGTLFLDEIGELAPPLQAKLLRALATGEVRPVGSTGVKHVDVRTIAATNRDLLDEVQRGEFRGDLYARLSAHVLRVPPLRERREDVLFLLRHFLRSLGCAATIEASAAERLLLHRWPFNVRELEAAAHALAAGASTTIELPLVEKTLEAGERISESSASQERLPPGASRPPSASKALPARSRPSREELTKGLAEARGNVAELATKIGRDRKQVYRWIELYGIELDQFR